MRLTSGSLPPLRNVSYFSFRLRMVVPSFSHFVKTYGAVVTVGTGPSILSSFSTGYFDQMCLGRIGTASLSRNSESRVERCRTNVSLSGADTDLTASIVPWNWFVLFSSTALNVHSASALENGRPSDQWMPERRWNVIVLPSDDTSAPFASAVGP